MSMADDVDDVSLAGVAGPAADFSRSPKLPRATAGEASPKYSGQMCLIVRPASVGRDAIWRGGGESGAELSQHS